MLRNGEFRRIGGSILKISLCLSINAVSCPALPLQHLLQLRQVEHAKTMEVTQVVGQMGCESLLCYLVHWRGVFRQELGQCFFGFIFVIIGV